MSSQAKPIASTVLSRRSLFRRFAGVEQPVRPPWSRGEEVFVELCTRCGDCVRACAEGVITVVRGYPQVDFTLGGCTFCGDCARACKSGALDAAAAARGARPWALRAAVGAGCLSGRGVVCRVCGEECELGAVRFRLVVGGSAAPEIGAECTGCGFCVAVCPVRAIAIGTEAS